MNGLYQLFQRAPRVLVIDDEPEIISCVEAILSDLSIDAASALGGSVGLRKLKEEDYDLVLCDIRMPHLDGIEILNKVRANGVQVPFVFMTGFTSTELLISAVRLGAIDFLMKPFSSKDVEGAIVRGLHVSVRERKIEQLLRETSDLGLPAISNKIEDLRCQISMLRHRRGVFRAG